MVDCFFFEEYGCLFLKVECSIEVEPFSACVCFDIFVMLFPFEYPAVEGFGVMLWVGCIKEVDSVFVCESCFSTSVSCESDSF